MNGRLHTHTHTHTHTRTHTHTDEMFGQKQIPRDHFYFFLNTGLWGGIFFSSY